MFEKQSAFMLTVFSFFLSLCVAVAALNVQRRLSTNAQPLSNKARAVLEHHIASDQLASMAKEKIEESQSHYVDAYRARHATCHMPHPVIEEIQ